MFLHLCVILFTGGGPGPSMHHRGVSVQGVSFQRGLCLGGSLPRGGLYQGDPPYGNARAVRILLEYILVISSVFLPSCIMYDTSTYHC